MTLQRWDAARVRSSTWVLQLVVAGRVTHAVSAAAAGAHSYWELVTGELICLRPCLPRPQSVAARASWDLGGGQPNLRTLMPYLTVEPTGGRLAEGGPGGSTAQEGLDLQLAERGPESISNIATGSEEWEGVVTKSIIGG